MNRSLTRLQVRDGRLIGGLDDGTPVTIELSIPAEGVVRLRCRPGADAQIVSNDGLLATERPADAPPEVTDTDEGVRITGPGVQMLWKHDGSGLRFGAYERFEEPSAATAPVTSGYEAAADGGPSRWTEVIKLSPDSAVYGGGESYQGPNLRGRIRRLRNTEVNRAAGRNTAYLNVPLLWSDAGWGLLVNTGAPLTADVAATHSEALSIEILGDELDLILFSGDAPTILRRYAQLTGLPRRLPSWAFGVWMSRSSYFTAAEMISVADELIAADCPVDVMHTDEWLQDVVLDVSAWSADIDRQRYPQGWTDELRARNIRVSVWINPYLATGSRLAKQACARGFVTFDRQGHPVGAADNPEAIPVDFYRPDARRWWSRRLTDVIEAERISAVLADFGEELSPEAVVGDGSTGLLRHNSYGRRYAETVAAAAQQVSGDDFVALCRSGTAGSQRYSAHWAGDLPSTWTGMASTLRALLSMALSGLSAITCDAGGYWTPESYERTKAARATMAAGQLVADVEPELYVRWVQWASLLPIMRFHGVGAREPTAYPEPARSAAIAACTFRKQLQPYVVEIAQTAAETGIPMMRPMPLAYPGDRGARDADLQYLLGPKLLVAPLLAPGGERQLWIPPGSWRPLRGTRAMTGPGWATVACALDEFPVWEAASP